MSNFAMEWTPEQITEANKVLDTLKRAGEQRLRDLRAYFLDNYPRALEAIASALNRREPYVEPQDNDALRGVLWAPVYSNMGIWEATHDGLTMRAERVTESSMVFSLVDHRSHRGAGRTEELPLHLITCPLEEAIAVVREEYKRYFTEVDAQPDVANLMAQEPPEQPQQPSNIAAVVRVDGDIYVSTGAYRGEGAEHWAQEKDRYGWRAATKSWNELRRLGPIEVIFDGVALDGGNASK